MEGKPVSNCCYSYLLKWRLEQNISVRYKETNFLVSATCSSSKTMKQLLLNNSFSSLLMFIKSFSQYPVDKLHHIPIFVFYSPVLFFDLVLEKNREYANIFLSISVHSSHISKWFLCLFVGLFFGVFFSLQQQGTNCFI